MQRKWLESGNCEGGLINTDGSSWGFSVSTEALGLTHFLGEISEEKGLERRTLSKGAIHELTCSDWPSNVRELRNVIEQLVALTEDPEIGARAVQQAIGGCEETPADAGNDLYDARDQFERAYIQKALADEEGHLQNTADALGIDRSTLWRKMQEHDL